jgi:hypothetical protein
MSLFREPDTRRSVFAEAMLAVVVVERRHSVLGIDAEAKRLLGEHPECGISFDELRNYLVRFAVRRRVAIDIG